MLFLKNSGRNRGPAMLFAPADSGQGRAWPGYESETTQLSAHITDLALSNSHPSLQVRARDGINWTVELGDRVSLLKAGLNDRMLVPGDQIAVMGHCAHEFGDFRIRALRLTVLGRDYNLAAEACLEA